MTGFGGSPPGEGEGQPGAPGGQVLQAQPGAGGQVLLPPGGAARDGRHGFGECGGGVRCGKVWWCGKQTCKMS